MSDSSKHVKPSSVAAFMLLPQFGRGFRKYSFIVPVFIRTIAVMFEQAGLLPTNHPAIRYGAEGVKKYSFFDLIGEAWYNLNVTNATPRQWSLFASVVLMIAFVVLSAIMTLFNVSTILIGTASAQIFDSVLGATDQASVVGAGYVPGIQMFDKTVPALGTPHGDYGIMILDKILRQGIAGVGTGSPIQTAVGSLMQIYNTGVMVIAGVMLFWAVLSIVVDTARTGQLGGGRHNMVWAPIRIVFGLGLLIPLGATGFSSGQFMVMKLAEWGSNWGTNAWVQYVTTVVGHNDQNLIASYSGTNTSDLIGQYTRIWICGVAYDSYLSQSQGVGVDPKQYVYPVLAKGLGDFGSQSVSFTNVTGGNLCGTIKYPTVYSPTLILAASPLASPLSKALAKYKRRMIVAYADLFVQMGAGDKAVPLFCAGGTLPCVKMGSLGMKAGDFACGFVNNMMDNPNVFFAGAQMGCAYASYCNSGTPGTPTYGDLPDTTCIVQMITAANASILKAQTAARADLDKFINGGNFLIDVQDRGWAGMGIWYHRIQTLNEAVSSMQVPQVSMTGGDPGNGGLGAKHAEKVNIILNKYDSWWLNLQNDQASAVGSPPNPLDVAAGPGKNIKTASIKSASKGLAASLISISPMKLADTVADFFGDYFGILIFSMIDPAGGDDNTYPLARLAKIGGHMMQLAVGIYFTMALLEIVGTGIVCGVGSKLINAGSVVGAFFSVCDAFEEMAESALPPIFLTMGSMLFFGGIMMRYYVPLLPFVSVAHSVLTWMISVFEATMMVPIAALSHLNTEGEGLAGHSKQIWILWLNVLMRPVLTVIGYVASFLIFNTFVVFLHEAFVSNTVIGFASDGIWGFFAKGMYSIIYVFIIYSAATSCFKLLDMIPDALFRWLGGSPDKSFDTSAAGALNAFSNVAMSFGSGYGKSGNKSSRWLDKLGKNNAGVSGSSGGSNPISPGGLTRHNIS